MSPASDRVECPDCKMTVQKKNLNKHYKRLHPGLDPYVREKEIRSQSTISKGPPGPSDGIAKVLLVILVLFILAAAGIMAHLFLRSDNRDTERPRAIYYASGDGAVINGTFYPASEPGRPTIYLVHDIGQDRSVWDDHAMFLQENDYNVLAIDLRGHGTSVHNIKTGDITYEWTDMVHEDFQDIALDIQGAYRWVHGEIDGQANTDAGELGAFIGAGRGGLYGLAQAALMSRERIVTAVWLSPTFDIPGMDVEAIEQVFQNYGDVRPLLMVASEKDSNAILAMDRILTRKEEDDEKNGEGRIVDGSARGADLMDNGHLRERILKVLDEGWINKPPSE